MNEKCWRWDIFQRKLFCDKKMFWYLLTVACNSLLICNYRKIDLVAPPVDCGCNLCFSHHGKFPLLNKLLWCFCKLTNCQQLEDVDSWRAFYQVSFHWNLQQHCFIVITWRCLIYLFLDSELDILAKTGMTLGHLIV